MLVDDGAIERGPGIRLSLYPDFIHLQVRTSDEAFEAVVEVDYLLEVIGQQTRKLGN